MSRFEHHENIALYKKLIAESQRDPSRDEKRHAMLLRLLADEVAKEGKPRKGQTLAQFASTVLTFATMLA